MTCPECGKHDINEIAGEGSGIFECQSCGRIGFKEEFE